MKNLIRNFLLISIFSCLSFNLSFTQSVATPAASSTGKAAESNVNYSNGTAAISYPIHTISELDLNLPVSLSYQTGGIRVTDIASDVGLGWSLNVGGSIHRSVRGLPDEILERRFNGSILETKMVGYLYTNENDFFCENCYMDTEPDVFFFNAGGVSGKFIFGTDDEIVMLTPSDVEISYVLGEVETNEISSFGIKKFQIKTPTGAVYHFGTLCDQSTSIPSASDVVVIYDEENEDVEYAFTQAWLIKEVYSPQRNLIEFNYQGDCGNISEIPRYDNFTLRSKSIDVAYTTLKDKLWEHCEPSNFSDSFDAIIQKTKIYTQRLKSIESKYTKVLFKPGDLRLDLNGVRTNKIRSIEIQKKKSNIWKCFKVFNFDQTYFVSNEQGVSSDSNINSWFGALNPALYPDMHRLKLNSIEESSCNEGLSYETIFEYHEEKVLPRRLSHSQDLWGFHNGEYNNRSLIPMAQFMYDCSSTLDLSESNCLSKNRNADLESSRLGSLKKVNYPNGNFQEYKYELNTINSEYFEFDASSKKEELIGCSNSTSEILKLENINLELGKEMKLELELFDTSCNFLGGDISTVKRKIKVYHKKTIEDESMYKEVLEVELKMGNNKVFSMFKNELIEICGLSISESNDLKFEITIPDQNLLRISTRVSIGNFLANNKDFEVGGLRIKEIKNSQSSVQYDYSWNTLEDLNVDNDSHIDIDLKICKECPETGGEGGSNCLGFLVDVQKNVTIPCGFNPELIITYDPFDKECNDSNFKLRVEWKDVNSNSMGYDEIIVYPGEDGVYSVFPSIQSNRTYDFKFESIPMGSQEHLTASAKIKFTKFQEYDFPNPTTSNSSGKLISVPTNISVKKSFSNTQIDGTCIPNDFDVFTLQGNANVTLQTMNGSHIVYGNVKETVMDGSAGSTVYSFSTESEMFDQHFYKNYLDPLLPVHIYSPASQDIFVEPDFGSLKSIRQYDNKDILVAKTENEYLSKQERLKFLKKFAFKNCDDEVVEDQGAFYMMKGTLLPIKTTSTVDGVATVTELSYDADLRHHNPIRTETYNLNTPDITRFSEIKYAYEYGWQDFIDANIIGIPFETLVQGGAGGGSKNAYSLDGNKLNLEGTYFLDNSDTWVLSTQVLSRNTQGQIEKIQKRSLPLPNQFVYEKGLITSTKYDSRETIYIYDDLRRLEKKIDPNGIWESYIYDDLHRLIKVLSKGKPGGDHLIETEYIYTIDPIGPELVTIITSFPGSDPSIEDQTIIQQYDDLGRLVKTTNVAFTHNGSDYSTNIFYDKFGRVELSCDPSKGGCDYFVYENSPLSRVLEVKPAGSPLRVTTSYGSNSGWKFGSPPNSLIKQTVTNENGQSSISYKDVFGKSVASENALGEVTKYLYNTRLQKTQVIPPGASEDDLLLVYKYSYNTLGLLEEKYIPGKAGPYVYTYHPDHDYLIREDMPNGHFMEFVHDTKYPSFMREVKLDGMTINTYTPKDLNKNNWVSKEEVAILDIGGTLTSEILLFDEFGKVLQETQEYLDAPTSTFNYTYDVLDNIRTYKNEHGGSIINKTFEYDKGIRATETIADFPGFAGVKLNSFNYDNKDWISSKNIGDLQKLSYTYNPRGWLKSINSVNSTFDLIPPECDEPETPDCEREETDNSHRVAHLQFNSADLSAGNSTNVVVTINNYYTASNGSTYSKGEQIVIPFNNGNLEKYDSYTDGEIFYISNEEESLAYRQIIESMISSHLASPSAAEFQDITNLITAVELYETAAMNGPGISTPGGNTPGGNGGSGGGDLFGMEIHYFDGNGDLTASPQYSGNISWIEWRVKEEITQSYGFQYDDINRLTRATYYGIDQLKCEALPEGAYDVNISDYDERGNIGHITRNGVRAWATGGGGPIYAQIDDLKLSYIGNQLSNVTESSTEERGYKSLGGSPLFTNGNQSSDNAFGMDIMYNFMNLPTSITSGSEDMTIIYDANGTKLKMTKNVNSITEETIYAGEFEYIDGDIKSIYHEEGRVVYQSEFPFIQGPQDYLEWQITDHLGNVKVRFTDRNSDGKIFVDAEDPVASEIIGSYHYYPFGMKMEGPWLQQQGDLNKHQYNGIETFDDFASGIGLTTFRVHDPALGRWLQVDPKAEANFGLSPYNCMNNNPISMADPNGDVPWLAIGIGLKFASWAVEAGNGGPNTFSSILDISSSIATFAAGDMSSIVKLGVTGIKPNISFGSNGFHIGVSAGIGLNTKWFNAGVNASIGYTHMNLGPNSINGFSGSVGAGIGVGFGHKDYNLGLYANQTFGLGVGQRVGGVRLNLGKFTAAYENDGAPFGGTGLNDEGDRWRTNAVSIGWGDYDLRLNMFTGEPNGPRRFDDPDNYPEGYHTGDADQFRLGALSFGKGNRRIGWNSEWIRNEAQNKFAHGIVKPQPWFKRMASGYPGSFYWQTSTFDNPYSLWSF